MQNLMSYVRQPSTLVGIGCVVGGAVYWFTGNAALALTAVGVVPGLMSDHTAALLSKIEALEDAVKNNRK